MAGKEITILGAGPAGLGAALELQKNNVKDILADHYYQYRLDRVFELWKKAIASDFSSYRLVAHKSFCGRRYREFGPSYYFHYAFYQRTSGMTGVPDERQ